MSLVQQIKSINNSEAAPVLEDGTIFLGKGFGTPKKFISEIIFSNSMVGYSELFNCPSYQGQFFSLRYHLIVNCGVSPKEIQCDLPLFFKSNNIQTLEYVIQKLCTTPNHWASKPAFELKTNRCYITTQNHGYTIENDCFEEIRLDYWFINANDEAVEEVPNANEPVFEVQWHLGAITGSYDTEFFFEKFVNNMENEN